MKRPQKVARLLLAAGIRGWEEVGGAVQGSLLSAGLFFWQGQAGPGQPGQVAAASRAGQARQLAA